jgi:hypothetical protein
LKDISTMLKPSQGVNEQKGKNGLPVKRGNTTRDSDRDLRTARPRCADFQSAYRQAYPEGYILSTIRRLELGVSLGLGAWILELHNLLFHNAFQPIPACAAGVYQLETQNPKLETIEPSQPPLAQRQSHPVAPNRRRMYGAQPRWFLHSTFFLLHFLRSHRIIMNQSKSHQIKPTGWALAHSRICA